MDPYGLAGSNGQLGITNKLVCQLQSSGSNFTIEAPWLFPTQNVTGFVAFSTKTLRTFVNRGRRYSMIWPVLGSRRKIRSLNSPPDQTSPFLSAVASVRNDV